MNKRFAKKAPLFLLLMTAFLVVGYLLFGRWDDGLGEPRRLAGMESTTMDGSWEWHEFQFSEPCSAVSDKLASWKVRWENGSREFAMSDMEDREAGPTTWARDAEFSLKAPIVLDKGKNCAFAIGVQSDKSLLSHMFGAFKQLLRRE